MPVAPRPTREHLDSELTLSPLDVLTDCVPSLPLRRLVGLFRCRFDQCNVQACALAACTVSVISTNDVAYLPGLPLRVPRRLWKVTDSNRLLILHFLRESPPLWSDAVALVSVGGPHPLIPILPVCTFIPAFPSKYVYPDCSLF